MSPSSPTTLYDVDSDKRNKSEEPSRVVCALFRDNDSKPTEIVMKRMYFNNRFRETYFYNEINMISSFEHKNPVYVSFLSYCIQ
nr:cysteine-rich receptor-like protein kinase 2 [Tanacetum cinerariifolium]